jgi:ferritin-like protein
MAASSATLHEDPEKLGPETIDRHRAIVSLMEELEAVDWYDQRIKAADDDDLRGILTHNRDEEKEHASMMLEWLRRRDPALDGHLRTFLFKDGAGPVSALADAAEEDGAVASAGNDGSLGIGSLRAAARKAR